jgi:hypothetical protein
MATTTYGSEYVQSSDLVSNWPGSSLNVANRIDDVSLKGNGLNNQTGTSYTLVLTDGGKLVTFSNAAAVSLTVPTNVSVAFPTGVRIKLTNKGAGTVTVAGAGGVTLNGNQLTISQNRSAMLYKLDTNTWVMSADPTVTAPGLTLITTQAITAVTTISVNNCFSGTYQNYMITLHMTTGASGASTFRLRASGTDASGSDYNQQRSSVISTIYAGSRNASQTTWFGHTYVTTLNYLLITLFRPNEAAPTAGIAQMGRGTDSGIDMDDFRLGHTLSTAYDGFTMGFGSSSTGTVRVYGLSN